MPPLALNASLRLTVPVITVGLCLLVAVFAPGFQNRPALFIFFGAVTISFWVGGTRAGLLAIVLSAAAGALALRLAHDHSADDVSRWCHFAIILGLMAAVCSRYHRTETVLRIDEQRVMLALESARAGIWDYNPIKKQFWWCKSLEQLVGRTDGSFPTTFAKYFSLTHFDDQPAVNRAMTRAIDEGIEFEVQHRIIMPDQSLRWICTRGRLFFDSALRTQRIVGLVTEIAEPPQRIAAA
jgi:PAS domain-containing protein